MRVGIAETLNKISELKTRPERIEALRVNNNQVYRQIFQYAYQPDIVWNLPEGDPPYKPCEFLDQEGRLYTELRRLYLFIKGGNDNLKQLKREQLFIQLLESVAPEDAKLLLAMKDKKLPYKTLDLKLIKEAIPDLLP